jgi:hypothetical protein
MEETNWAHLDGKKMKWWKDRKGQNFKVEWVEWGNVLFLLCSLLFSDASGSPFSLTFNKCGLARESVEGLMGGRSLGVSSYNL